jgi:hypothetical protein
MLCQALRDAGYTAVQHHKVPKNLYGYRGDQRKETAEIIIPRNCRGGMQSASNDLGFKLNADGVYEAIISDFDKSVFTDKVFSEVKQGYTEGLTKRTMALRGLRWTQTTIVNGNRNLEFAVI